MRGEYVKNSISAGLISFVLFFLFFLVIHSPSPHLAAFTAGFITFEITFYHSAGKEKDKNKFL